MAKDAAKNTWDSVKTHGPDIAKDMAKSFWRSRSWWYSWRPYDEEPASEADCDIAQKVDDLHQAAIHNNKDAIFALVKDGVDVNAKRADGETALHWAAKLGNEDAIFALVIAGADKDAKNNDGNTPLEIAKDDIEVQAAYRRAQEFLRKMDSQNNPET